MNKMKKVTITINTENAAFEEDNCGIELARILRCIANSFENVDIADCPIFDINDNKCGKITVK
jgi:hypothetical protein